MVYIPFIHERKQSQKPLQVPLQIELEEPKYIEKKKDKKEENIIIIELL